MDRSRGVSNGSDPSRLFRPISCVSCLYASFDSDWAGEPSAVVAFAFDSGFAAFAAFAGLAYAAGVAPGPGNGPSGGCYSCQCLVCSKTICRRSPATDKIVSAYIDRHHASLSSIFSLTNSSPFLILTLFWTKMPIRMRRVDSSR